MRELLTRLDRWLEDQLQDKQQSLTLLTDDQRLQGHQLEEQEFEMRNQVVNKELDEVFQLLQNIRKEVELSSEEKTRRFAINKEEHEKILQLSELEMKSAILAKMKSTISKKTKTILDTQNAARDVIIQTYHNNTATLFHEFHEGRNRIAIQQQEKLKESKKEGWDVVNNPSLEKTEALFQSCESLDTLTENKHWVVVPK